MVGDCNFICKPRLAPCQWRSATHLAATWCFFPFCKLHSRQNSEPQQSAHVLPDGQDLSAATASASLQANGKAAGQQHATECQQVQPSAHSKYSDAAPAHLPAEQELCDRRSTASDCLQAPKEATLWHGHLQGDASLADSHCQCDDAVPGLSDRLQDVKLQKSSHPG